MADLFTIGIVLSAIDKASSVIGQMTNNSIAHLKRLEERFKEIGDKMQSMGLKSMAAGAVMTGAIQKAISTFADLEEAQAFLKTTLMDETGAVGKEYEELNRLAEKLGTELPGTTKDMIEMFIALREQGVQTKYILGGVGEAAAKFAVLMKLPYKEAATYVAKFQEALGVAEKDMIQFMDILQRGKFAAGIEIRDLAYTIRYLAPSLKTLNLQGVQAAKEISAVIGVMATNAIEGSTAGTSLAQALQRMAEISHRLESKKMKELVGDLLDAKGIKLEFFTEEGQFKGIRGMIAELEKLKALNPEERIIVLSKLFGMEAARPLSVIVDKGLEGYDEMIQRMEKQADMQKKIAEITSTTKQRWDAFTGTLQNTIAYFGGATTKALQLGKFLKILNDVLDKINDFMTKHKTLAGIIGAGIAVIGGLLLVVGGGLMLFGIAVKVLGSAIGGIRTFISFMKIARVWTMLAWQEVLRFIGVQKIMNSISYHGGFWKTMQYWLYTTNLKIFEALGALRTWVAAQWAVFRSNFLTIAGLKNMAKVFATTLFSAIKSATIALRVFATTIFTTPVGWIALALTAAAFLIIKFWKPISGFFKGLWQGLKEGLKGLEPAWDIFKKVAIIFAPIIIPLKLIYNLVKWLIKPVDDTGNAAENLGVRFGKAIGKILSSILTLPTKMFEAGKKIIEALWQGMKSVINKPVEVMESVAQKIRNFLPFSPAKEGPLKDLHKVNIVGTIASAITPAPIMRAMFRIGEAIKGVAIGATMRAGMPAPALASAGMPSINITQNISFSGVDKTTAQEMTAKVSTVTKEAVWRAIDEYFKRKQKAEWR